MGNFRYKLAQFMIGRNGLDAFNIGLIKLILIIVVADLFIPGRFLGNMTMFMWIYIYARVFIRNSH